MTDPISSHRTLLMGYLANHAQLTADLTWKAVTGSTNVDLSCDLKAAQAHNWSVRIASSQSAGRGRQGRSWDDAEGSIAVSIAVDLTNFQPTPTWLSMLTAVALKHALAEVGIALQVKWPNDCFTEVGKVAGILVEREDNFAVIGIGINFAGAPPIPTAAAIGISEYHQVLANFLLQLYKIVSTAASTTNLQLQQLIRPEISTIGQEVEVNFVDGKKLTGTATSLGETGALIVELAGQTIEVTAADVIHLRPADVK